MVGVMRITMKKPKKTDRDTRLVILGLDNAGKTTIIKALCDEELSTITPTQGFNVKTMAKDGFKLNVWDVGGQREIRKFWKNYYYQTEAIIYVIDSSDRKRISECGSELSELLGEDELAGLPLLVYANKQDLIQALPAEELAEKLNLMLIKDRLWCIVACSAKTKEGLIDGLEWLTAALK